MSLDNLTKTGQLKPHAATSAEISRLLAAAKRNLRDAAVSGISDETRFDAAYKAIMQCALAALMASGYRPSTGVPGHHHTTLASLSLTMHLPKDEWLVLDVLRKKRNVNDYSGDLIDPESVQECITRASALHANTEKWLKAHHPRLLQHSK